MKTIMKGSRTLRKRITVWSVTVSLIMGILPQYPAGAKQTVDISEWIAAYREFLETNAYLTSGQNYKSAESVTGLFYDMDHDGIPELIMEDGYQGPRYIYSYQDHEVQYLGEGPSVDGYYYKVSEGSQSDLYGLYYKSSDYVLDRYTKKGVKVTSKQIQEYKDFAFGLKLVIDNEYQYGYLSDKYVDELCMELSAFEVLSNYTDDYIWEFDCLEDLLYQYDFCTGHSLYDFQDIDNTNPWIMYDMVMSPSLAFLYDLEIEENWNWEGDGSSDPRGSFDSYLSIKESDARWVAQTIYNISDEDYDRLLQEVLEDPNCYLEDGRLYSLLGGVGGPGRNNIYTDFYTDGDYFYVTYSVYYDYYGSLDEAYQTEDERTFQLALKTVGDQTYWSLYRVTEGGLDDLDSWGSNRDYLSQGFSKFVPYSMVALKAASNGCYVTCDIGTRENGTGKYDKYESPSFNVDATEIHSYEMFDLVPHSDGYWSLQMYMNRKYLARNLSGVRQVDFSERNEALDIVPVGDYNKIKFVESGQWLSVKDNKLVLTSQESEAELFEIETISDNAYTDEQLNILCSGEWFQMDGTGVGYWDIQKQIGEDKNRTAALDELGYTRMRNKKTGIFIEKKNGSSNTDGYLDLGNMRCAIGVKETDGIYDVIITFQGTDGGINRDLLSNTTGVANVNAQGQHEGYYQMAKKVMENESEIIATVNGQELTLQQLINWGRFGKAHFTLLGHSMGGAIAQCYAIHLYNSGISKSMISGRTFNSALAVNYDDDEYSDWYNLCVTSDSVPRGCVPGSINRYGIHRIGHTIWLYDDEPDVLDYSGFENASSRVVGNIALNKHNMDEKIYDILLYYSSTADGYVGHHDIEDGLYVTNKAQVPVYSAPSKNARQVGTISDGYTFVDVKAFLYNSVGNKWYQTTDGYYIYSRNVNYVRQFNIDSQKNGRYTFTVSSQKAPLRSGLSKTCEVISYLGKGTVITAQYAVYNQEGNLWLYVEAGGTYGWLYSDHVNADGQPVKKRLKVECPVNVKLYNAEHELVASITNDGDIYNSDDNKILLYVLGESKIIDILGDESYQLEIEAVSDGVMNYSVAGDYDEVTGEYVSYKEFEAVNLETDQCFTSQIDEDGTISKTQLQILDQDGKAITKISDDGKESYTVYGYLTIDEGRNAKRLLIIISCILALTLIAMLLLLLIVRRNKKTKVGIIPKERSAPARLIPDDDSVSSVHSMQSVDSLPADSAYCRACGAPLEIGDRFCGVCGTKRG